MFSDEQDPPWWMIFLPEGDDGEGDEYIDPRAATSWRCDECHALNSGNHGRCCYCGRPDAHE